MGKKKSGMNMEGGITLKSGREIHSSKQLANLSPEELEELAKKPITMLQYLFLKKERHEFINEVQSVSDRLSNIEEALIVKVPNNGHGEREVSIGTLVSEMYERERSKRLYLGFKRFVKYNKKVIGGAVFIGLVISYALRHHLADAISWIVNNFPKLFSIIK
jgi:hypothetical protein